jgi:hypothetical protein
MIRATIVVCLMLASDAPAQSAPSVKSLGPEPPQRVLWVGHSYFYFNNGLPDFVGELLDAADPKNGFEAKMVTISGAPLSWHDLATYLRPGALQGFSIGADGALVFKKSPPFSAVIMADCSQCPIHPRLKASFHETTRKDGAIARQHGAKPVLFMTWAYADRPEMTAQLAEEYTRAGNASGALVVPVGLAFAAARARAPSINLYTSDGRHPSVAGSYLAACTVLAAVYGKSPIGNTYRADLDEKTATVLQTVADETARKYFGK